MKNLSNEAAQVIEYLIDEFSTVDEMISHYSDFGFCRQCGDFQSDCESPCCDNCGAMTVIPFTEAVEAYLARNNDENRNI